MPPIPDKQPRHPTLKPAYISRGPTAPLTPKVAAVRSTHITSTAGRRAAAAAAKGTGDAPPPPPALALRDEYLTPTISATISGGHLLSANVTQRTGPRQSRVELSSSSAGGTPTLDKEEWDLPPMVAAAAPAGTGTGPASGPASGPGTAPGTAPGPGFLTPEVRRQSGGSSIKFFHASHARTPPQTSDPTPAAPVLQQKPSIFYANGDPVLQDPRPAPTSQEERKFTYLPNGGGVGSDTQAATGSTSPVSSGSFGRAGPAAEGLPPRPKSPTGHHPLQGHGQGQGHGHGLRAPVSLSTGRPKPGIPTLGASLVAKRRVSVEVAPRPGTHSRAGSIDSPVGTGKASSPRYCSGQSSPASPGVGQLQPAMTMASRLQPAEAFSSAVAMAAVAAADHAGLEMAPQPGFHSPTKSVHSASGGGGAEVNDLVANARRERKVQDLEITNASLEAINRTLERKLRKQMAELRQYKRISRSGRLSLAAAVPSELPSKIPSGVPSLPAAVGLGLSDLGPEAVPGAPYQEPRFGPAMMDLSEEEESEPESDLGSLSSSDEEGSGEPSVGAGTERGQRRRNHDERRLRLDLSKHHQLLIDSQKMNQSLKRCLDWTEELIREGQKALVYHVRVSDVTVGPQALAARRRLELTEGYDSTADGDDGDGHDRKGDGSGDGSGEGDDGMSETQGTEEWIGEVRSELPKWSEKVPDRDSGVDLPPDVG